MAVLPKGFLMLTVLMVCKCNGSSWYGDVQGVHPSFDIEVPSTMGIRPADQQQPVEETTLQTTVHTSSQSDKRYKVATVEFHRVETPFLIGIWIFFASLAKIGNFIY